MSNVLFKNKKTKDSQPDYKGGIELPDGTQYDIAAWVKKDKNGNDYFSLKVSQPFEKKEEKPKERPQEKEEVALDDQIPF